ncbi:DUF5906 domain-containing protein [Acinetobacter radioresistens]|jgi:putative DNA primase/helicase|uniref:NrS-1 polymerase-like helicase domain-containing protein n=1 Tax=Acinetobacter radioresistens SK82 TaxID=596318 RepID=A0ABP2GJD5_ACIRA|nr:DUF5906 domain-containing protein [Acinetobacter radioresistens]EET81318.1 hypothetical protein ACIRA0001_0099 [Acinetobacter radioresistens SK82]ENV87148.1 hypothetical protein F940_01121 [Acinetobacter radioresistens NIPH 2130]MBA5699773.1 hypothetical protein [Acinetobacter radioresistens]MCK4092616.1 hypothetical protein [Acinetobacter radioresistens]MCK4104664.1 hypothetical protein [Acinetobacter radioresistens]
MNSKVYTDFNDLHVACGLKEVSRQIQAAISSLQFSPEPPEKPANNFQGQDLAESENLVVVEKGDAGISTENTDLSEEELLAKWLARFCLIEGETNIWDEYGKKIWKKSAFTTMLGGKKVFDQWNGHLHRKTITRDDVDGRLEDGGHKKAKEMIDRFIMLEGKKACWDTFRRELVGTDVMKDNWAGAYDLWVKSKEKRMIWHENLVFDPTMKTKEGQINTYDGMIILPLLDTNNQMLGAGEAFESCIPIINLLKFLCGNENNAYEWILKWLAYPLQHPGAKMNTSILMCSAVQGSGKSLFFEKVMTRIYGEKYSVTLGQNGLESIYTDWAERKLYCLFEEIFNNKSKFGMMGLIKHMITGEKIRIEKKFMSGYSQNNHINCVFLSNEVQPLAIEERDRRFLVLEPNQKLNDDLKKHIELCLEPDSQAISAFYTYLLNLDLTDFNEYTEPPMTKAKQKIIQFGLPGWKLFLDDWRGGYLKYPFVCCLSDDLYTAYREWCHKNGEKIIASNKFLNLVASERVVAKGHGRIYESVLNGPGTGYADKPKEVQRRIVFTSNPPEGIKQADWLSSQVEQFRATLKGVHDVPPVL